MNHKELWDELDWLSRMKGVGPLGHALENMIETMCERVRIRAVIQFYGPMTKEQILDKLVEIGVSYDLEEF